MEATAPSAPISSSKSVATNPLCRSSAKSESTKLSRILQAEKQVPEPGGLIVRAAQVSVQIPLCHKLHARAKRGFVQLPQVLLHHLAQDVFQGMVDERAGLRRVQLCAALAPDAQDIAAEVRETAAVERLDPGGARLEPALGELAFDPGGAGAFAAAEGAQRLRAGERNAPA